MISVYVVVRSIEDQAGEFPQGWGEHKLAQFPQKGEHIAVSHDGDLYTLCVKRIVHVAETDVIPHPTPTTYLDCDGQKGLRIGGL